MTKRFASLLLCSALLSVAIGAGAGVASAAGFTAGSAGLGDPMFPNAGKGGYAAQHYALKLDYVPAPSQLPATAVITATATQNLSSFNLDLRGLTISRLLVNGRPATFTRDDGQELTITPSSGLVSGSRFTTTIDYAGTPSIVT